MEWTLHDNSEKERARRVVVIVGPTASGKSAIALDIARHLGGTIVNADAIQAYRDLPILTAQPSLAELQSAPHKLYGYLDSDAVLSAASWANLAKREIDLAIAEGRPPIVVGGTGLYLRALMHGLSPIPAVPKSVHDEVRALLGEIGSKALHAKLTEVDPVTSARLHPNDAQRIARAWEVYVATGRPLSSWQGRSKDAAPLLEFLGLVLSPERPDLGAAIHQRVERMIQSGAVSEVESIIAKMPESQWRPAAGRVLGFKEIASHLTGQIGLDEAAAALQKKTSQYAKRQMTWIRHQFNFSNLISVNRLFTQLSEKELTVNRHKIRSFLLTT